MSRDAPRWEGGKAAGLRIGVVAACFNGPLVDGLLARVQARLRAAGVRPANLEVMRVPGSHEVPWAVHELARARTHDCVVGLGVLVAGETNHHEMVGASVSQALQQVALATRVPVINGVIVASSRAQARARCLGRINRGAEFAEAALAMAALRRRRVR
ncbi:MAG: 6,7-dimethyl-8-ribityllumazine synthase [Verrucomicrobia bacterium]|nr:6,7-dimethyl-8-ribityllumazine synthase [Verrucomicrobiota bacterium]